MVRVRNNIYYILYVLYIVTMSGLTVATTPLRNLAGFKWALFGFVSTELIFLRSDYLFDRNEFVFHYL